MYWGDGSVVDAAKVYGVPMGCNENFDILNEMVHTVAVSYPSLLLGLYRCGARGESFKSIRSFWSMVLGLKCFHS